MLKVAVVDTTQQPLAPTTPRRARLLLKRGKAAVFRRFPFTIILKREVENPALPDLKLKIDPGSKMTGVTIVNQETGEVVFAAEIEHRGAAIKQKLDDRRAVRRHRRNRKTRYRKARFLNRTRPKGWLPPSLESRVANIETWTRRLSRAYPIKGIAFELIRFDMQLIENPEISGVEYQQGELAGYELKEYLLIKFDHECAYQRAGSPCDKHLEVEHINPRSRGGTNRISNLTIACRRHNQEKGARTAAEYGFPEIEAQAKRPLKDAAAVITTRWELFERLKSFKLPIETGSGGLTKFNRLQRDLPKTHWIDAACVGASTPEALDIKQAAPIAIKAVGHGSRRMCLPDKFGFPRTSAKGARVVKGFRTGDIVKAVVPNGKKAGTYVGKVAVRSSGSFNVTTAAETIQGISYRHCAVLHKADGFAYRNLSSVRAGVDPQHSHSIPNSSPAKPPKTAAMAEVSFGE
ncbi:MAG: RNA-guided endonuclease IscB [Blastocatellia bacterium]